MKEASNPFSFVSLTSPRPLHLTSVYRRMWLLATGQLHRLVPAALMLLVVPSLLRWHSVLSMGLSMQLLLPRILVLSSPLPLMPEATGGKQNQGNDLELFKAAATATKYQAKQAHPKPAK